MVLADAHEAPGLAALLAAETGGAACYGSVDELVRSRPLSSISILVLRAHGVPKGILLAALGRMAIEYPEIQKVVVLDAPPPLPIAEYLAACRVALVWNDTPEAEAHGLASLIHRLHERTPWIAS